MKTLSLSACMQVTTQVYYTVVLVHIATRQSNILLTRVSRKPNDLLICVLYLTAEQTDEVFGVEEVIQKETVHLTGWRGNPYYAAELGLYESKNSAPTVNGIYSFLCFSCFCFFVYFYFLVTC